MPVFIKVTQNNIKDSKSYGKWYGRVATTKTMTYQELCKHMSEHNSVYGEDVCLGVANKLQSCMLEQLLEGKKVQFGELGVFYLSVKSTGAVKEEDFNLGININGLFLCFAPSRTDVNNLSSKMLKKKASFMNVKDLIESKAKSSSEQGDSTSGGNTEADVLTIDGVVFGHVFTEFLVGHGLGSGDAAVPLAVGLGVLDLVLGNFNENGHNLLV